MKGLESKLAENLETFFKLDYPAFEVIFSVMDANDPALLVAQSLVERYPNVDAKCFVNSKSSPTACPAPVNRPIQATLNTASIPKSTT